ncbi:hypothetical protein SLNWT_3612 [Streptomyces albus]|uniref:Uncharacterized protein n=1 Tax=Streptomyces albus (strain ATCC 21838 / DSM 41398 / FERM P-419 / JCM 4703 / NBRC 107858) TaxID=1081613 RepID=A0A0B5EN46_STRA4|nr:hypothetical protein SLNWT_3612 [Streptomyces albus]AOU78292.1 hypothetical protein SLNHY_3601 [Streptomyces albus]AYN34043.1 hypothetical protein DUI70_3542 [Streptomyces albus]
MTHVLPARTDNASRSGHSLLPQGHAAYSAHHAYRLLPAPHFTWQ